MSPTNLMYYFKHKIMMVEMRNMIDLYLLKIFMENVMQMS